MNIAALTWQAHRLAIDRLGFLPPFLGSRHKRLLFITENNPLCHTQLYPFWHHRAELASRYGIVIRELPLARFKTGRHPYAGKVDAVCFQSWFDLAPEALAELAQRIQSAFPQARLAYMDWFAPTDLRYAEVLNPYISAYVKKQVLRDRGQYGATLLGDTNLTDYYARRFDLPEPPTRHPIPEDFWDKLWIGTHFAFSDHMLPYFLGDFPAGPRDIDLHARIAVKGTPWYTAMRQEALDKVVALENSHRVVCQGRVSRKEYFGELFRAKLCFSPFGYGEVCWRDFEAMFTGSLLLKPEMSHLDCYPEVFLPNETYVPLAWDLSDFEEKVAYYLDHEAEREAIARRAFEVLRDYFRQQRFMDDVRPLLTRLGLAGEQARPRAGTVPASNPRVLLSAYQCGPGMGSVSHIGWEWYRRLAARAAAPVTLVTHIRNRAALEQADAPLPNTEIVYIDTEWFAGPLYRLASRLFKNSEHPVFLMSSLDFYVYDEAALRILRRRRAAGEAWDVVHQPTPVSPLASTRLHRLGLPLVLGPWNGGLRSPEAFPEIMRAESAWIYRVRALGKFIDLMRGATRHARLILAATASTRADLPAASLGRCRSMLENGVDTDVFRPMPWPAPPSAMNPLKVLFVGRLLPFKGVAMLLQAIAQVRAHNPVELAIVGAGSEEAALRAQVEALNLAEAVRFAGALGQAGVAAAMAEAHVFCLPSVRESGGAVLLEAMASARPVIALDYGGPAEIVDPDIGLLIPATGHRPVVEALALALGDIIDNPEVWQLRGMAGRTRVEQRYGWDAKIDAALALYREIL